MVAWQLGREAAEELFRIDGKGPLHFSADGRYLFLNGRDGLKIWDWQANTRLEHPVIPSYFDLGNNTSVVLTQNYEMGQIQIWNGIVLLPVKPVAVELKGNQIVTLGGLRRNVLLQNFPNPFNPETWIPFRLEKEDTVTINIYGQSRSLVRTLPYGIKPAGDYATREKAAYWDGKNFAGEPVASGNVFLYANRWRFYRNSDDVNTEIGAPLHHRRRHTLSVFNDFLSVYLVIRHTSYPLSTAFHRTRVPGGIFFSNVATARSFPSAAASNIPCDLIPRMVAGSRFATSITCFPMRLSGV